MIGFSMTLRLSAVFLPLAMVTVLALSGCSTTKQVSFVHTPKNMRSVGDVRVKTTVVDARKGVIDGTRAAWDVGRYTAGTGYVRSFSTLKKVPFAQQFHYDLLKELRALGIGNVKQTERAKQIDVLIQEWDFDGTAEGVFRYKIKITVTDERGRVQSSGTVSNSFRMKDNLITGKAGNYETFAPKIYRKVIASLIRGNRQALNALLGPA